MRIARGSLGSGIAALLAMTLLAAPVAAQNSRAAERKLQTIKRELEAVAAERRKLEGKRGAATRELRAADEQVGQASRSLRETEQYLASSEAELAQLQQQRDRLHVSLGGQRAELAQLLRAAYLQGDAAPLKVLLAQDRIADSTRVLTYHRYLQRARAARIASLTSELAGLEALERKILDRRTALDAARAQEREQLAKLEQERKARAVLVSDIDGRYRDRRSREQTLGRDAKGLEQLLRKLRAAAARVEAERRAAAAKAAREAAAREAAARAAAARAASSGNAAAVKPAPVAPARPAPTTVASAPAPKVGGLGWPLSGSLVAGYRGKMPDGRSSDGLLIGANAGAPVQAVADGTVVYAEWMTGYGLLLIVDHGNDYMSLYAHNDALLRDVGDRVRRGEAVSTVGSSGGHGRPALYFELRRGGTPVDPNTWLKR